MITKNDLDQLIEGLEMLDKQRKFYEDQSIISILKIFGIPEHKSESIKSIPDFLEKDNILIWMPKSVWETIDFTKLTIPKKLKFTINPFADEWQIIGVNDFDNQRMTIEFPKVERLGFVSLAK